MKIFLALLLSVVVVSAAELKLPIVRVFMHTPGDYSVMYMVGTNSVIHVTRISSASSYDSGGVIAEWSSRNHSRFLGSTFVTSQTIVADVPADKPMYVHLIGKRSSVDVVIHIHSPQEVSGGEWSTSTGGRRPVRGQTVVVK